MKIKKRESIYLEKIVVATMLMLMFFTAGICCFYRQQQEGTREVYHGRHQSRPWNDCEAPSNCPYKDNSCPQAEVSYHYSPHRGIFRNDLKFVLKEAYHNKSVYQKEKEKLLSDHEFAHHGPPVNDEMLLSSHTVKNDVFCIFNDSEYAIVYGYFSAGVRPNVELFEKLKKF